MLQQAPRWKVECCEIRKNRIRVLQHNTAKDEEYATQKHSISALEPCMFQENLANILKDEHVQIPILPRQLLPDYQL